MPTSISKTFPALRARMGDRWYYATTMTFAEAAKWIHPIGESHEPVELKNWLQRNVREERIAQISTYLRTRPQRFFNSVVVGIYGGEPEWLPVTIENAGRVQEIELGERQSTAYGIISISGNEHIFAIDGQHRIEGIRESLKQGEELAQEELSVIFVSHKLDDEGRERTRRLFTTLNKYARPVSQAEQIALNDDDSFAIVTRRLIDEQPGLSSHFIPLNQAANLLPGDEIGITTVIGLYEVVKAIALPARSRDKKALEEGPSDPERVEEIYSLAVRFWEALKDNIPPLYEAMTSDPSDKIAGKYRTQDGGNLLFRPAGLSTFSKATRVMIDRGETIANAVALLSSTSLELNDEPWRGVLWNPATKTMILKYRKLSMNLLLRSAGQAPSPQRYDTTFEYRRALGSPDAELPLA